MLISLDQYNDINIRGSSGKNIFYLFRVKKEYEIIVGSKINVRYLILALISKLQNNNGAQISNPIGSRSSGLMQGIGSLPKGKGIFLSSKTFEIL